MTQSNHSLVLDAFIFSVSSEIAAKIILCLMNTDEFHINVLITDKELWGWSKQNKTNPLVQINSELLS